MLRTKMRFVVVFMLGLCLGLLGGCRMIDVSSPSHVGAAADLVSKSVALVSTNRSGELRAYCSGVWVSPALILTANHCVAESELGEPVDYTVKKDVQGEVQASRSSTLVLRDADHDLALLLASAPPSHGVALLSQETIAAGLPVQAMGNPLGMWFSYSTGVVAAVRVIPSALDVPMLFVQATAPISPGSSGGGLFDEAGDLVGITHASFQKGQAMNLWIHIRYVAPLLRKAGVR